MWTLYRQKFHDHVYHYIWVSPDGKVAYNRVICPLGWVTGSFSLVGRNFKEFRKNAPDACRKVSTKMTQEQLSKGWLA